MATRELELFQCAMKHYSSDEFKVPELKIIQHY